MGKAPHISFSSFDSHLDSVCYHENISNSSSTECIKPQDWE